VCKFLSLSGDASLAFSVCISVCVCTDVCVAKACSVEITVKERSEQIGAASAQIRVRFMSNYDFCND